jgi:hypothetical protein
LLRLNTGLESDPGLAAEYQAVNERYFDSRLPAVPVRWEARLEEIGPFIAAGFRLEGVTDGQLILLNPALQQDPQKLRRALCHEIVHVALGDRSDGHGPQFQSLLRRLSDQGAFEGIVATEEEKEDLQASLRARAEEMDKETSRLREARSELDEAGAGLKADVDDLNARMARANEQQSGWPPESEREAARLRGVQLQERSADYNWRVQRLQREVDDFNRLVGQYNLMIAYPDGLARERLAPRAAASPAK